MAKHDPRITKRRVSMRSVQAIPGGVAESNAVDYVLPEDLDAYVADAKTRWQEVAVSDEPDAGPAGFDGPTDRTVHLRGL